jgi:hypothetical protein
VGSVADLMKQWFEEYPESSVYVEVKFDGARLLGMRKGDKVKIWTEGGEDVTDKLPHLKADLLKIKASEFILDSECVPYDEKGRSLGRAAAVAMMGKKEVDDSNWVAHVFDLLYLNGEDLHRKPYDERRKILRGLELPCSDIVKMPIKFHWQENIPRVCSTVEQVIKATEEVSEIPYSEGAMYKLSESDYPIVKRSPLWAKLKKSFDIDCLVVHLFPKTYQSGPDVGKPIPGQNNLACVIGPVKPPEGAAVYDVTDLWKEDRSLERKNDWKNHKVQYVRYKGKVYSNIGLTMSTAEDVKVGDIVRVTMNLVNKINDTEYHWVIARVLEPRPEKTEPDPVGVAEEIAKVSQYRLLKKRQKASVEVKGEEYVIEEEYEELSPEERVLLGYVKEEEVEEVE